MKRPLTSSGYSLIEVTPALGVAGFCLIATFGDYSLLPVAEIQPTPGVLVDTNNNIVVASQIMGVGANNKV
jgi:hypothetical protein